SLARPRGAVLPLRGVPALVREVDVAGSLLAVVALGALVWAFAAADPATEVVAHGAVLLPVAALAAVAFWLHERRTPDPVLPLSELRPPGAWGALLVNLLVGAALVAALVDVPLFARNTTTPGDQLGAALVLLRLLVAVPVGAVAGGWLCRSVAPRLVAAAGTALAALALWAMTGWDETSLDGAWSTVVLLAAGLGFGLAIAPVNAVLLAVTGPAVHGSVSALAVVARTVGMLVGLSLLTAVALRRFTAEVEAIGSPLGVCPDSPADCPAYEAATGAAVLTQLHTVFAGAAVAAALAAVAALALLRDHRGGR
ncbi:MAG TPA: MFS transporter, partial [Geodermatophilus sp.]|nr:MFS transporter [Geodermatophilus sp.]